MEPPGSAEISQIATNLCGSLGDPENNFFFVKYEIDFMKKILFQKNKPLTSSAIHGELWGVSKDLASGIFISLGVFGPQ